LKPTVETVVAGPARYYGESSGIEIARDLAGAVLDR
jgi:hypothetical protein